MHDDDDVQRFNVHLKVDRSQLSLAYSAKIKTDMPENKKKTAGVCGVSPVKNYGGKDLWKR